ncbi:ionotropic receptor 21a-like [Palaemon carinicauda]|uniref:ionotropic receptor 21a-like n=1 Tax=Palaemon carinicauda TaxID=392227 RepID=UPI0035B5B1F6
MNLHFFTLLSAVVQVTSQESIPIHLSSQVPLLPQSDSNDKLNSKTDNMFQELLTDTLVEVFNGPLSGKSLVLALDAVADQIINVNELLSSIPTSFILLREWEDPHQNTSNSKITHLSPEEETTGALQPITSDERTWSSKEFSENTTVIFPEQVIHTEDLWVGVILTGAVLVYVYTGENFPILDSPPLSWSLAALLIVSISENCDENLLQTELASRTSSLAVMCPMFIHSSAQRTIEKPTAFAVHTWQPFHPQSKRLYIGRWSSLSSWDDLFVDRFRSFHGTILHLASDNAELPYFYTANDGAMDGINKRMLDTIGAWLNFSYVPTQEADELNWGEKINGTWDGFLGEIWGGTKDLTINGFSNTYERAKDFDFTHPYSYEGYGFAVRQPSPLPRWQSIIYPFSVHVWGALVLTLIVTPVTFYLLQITTEQMSYVKCLFLITKSLVNQSVAYRPKILALRIFIAFWWFSAYVTGIIYACNLISFFTVPVYPRRITTLKQLAQSPFRLCMLDYGDFVSEALSTTNHPLLSALGRKLQLVPVDMNKEYLGEEDCVERMMESPFVHLEFLPFLESSYSQMGITDKVYFVNEVIYKNSLVIFFKKHKAWKYKFDQGILRFLEAGLIQKWNYEILNKLRKHSKLSVLQAFS